MLLEQSMGSLFQQRRRHLLCIHLTCRRLRLTLADEEAGRQEDTLAALRDAGRLAE